MSSSWYDNTPERGYYTEITRETGLERNQAAANMYAFALAAPAEYQALRAKLERDVTHELVKKMYDTIYAALLEGEAKDGTDLIIIPTTVVNKLGLSSNKFSPKFPQKDVAKAAFAAATGLIAIMSEQVVDRLMPSTMNQIATQKIAAKTSANLSANEYMER